MGKITAKDAEALKKSGILSTKSLTEMERKGMVSKTRVTKRYIKTADGKWVEPSFYFRGGKSTKLSKRQVELVNKINNLVESYTTTRSNSK